MSELTTETKRYLNMARGKMNEVGDPDLKRLAEIVIFAAEAAATEASQGN